MSSCDNFFYCHQITFPSSCLYANLIVLGISTLFNPEMTINIVGFISLSPCQLFYDISLTVLYYIYICKIMKSFLDNYIIIN